MSKGGENDKIDITRIIENIERKQTELNETKRGNNSEKYHFQQEMNIKGGSYHNKIKLMRPPPGFHIYINKFNQNYINREELNFNGRLSYQKAELHPLCFNKDYNYSNQFLEYEEKEFSHQNPTLTPKRYLEAHNENTHFRKEYRKDSNYLLNYNMKIDSEENYPKWANYFQENFNKNNSKNTREKKQHLSNSNKAEYSSHFYENIDLLSEKYNKSLSDNSYTQNHANPNKSIPNLKNDQRVLKNREQNENGKKDNTNSSFENSINYLNKINPIGDSINNLNSNHVLKSNDNYCVKSNNTEGYINGFIIDPFNYTINNLDLGAIDNPEKDNIQFFSDNYLNEHIIDSIHNFSDILAENRAFYDLMPIIQNDTESISENENLSTGNDLIFDIEIVVEKDLSDNINTSNLKKNILENRIQPFNDLYKINPPLMNLQTDERPNSNFYQNLKYIENIICIMNSNYRDKKESNDNSDLISFINGSSEYFNNFN
jgi:hypothetical protein